MKPWLCKHILAFLLTGQALSFPGLKQDGSLSIQMSWLAPFTQVGLRNVLPVNAHAVYVLPSTEKNNKSLLINF